MWRAALVNRADRTTRLWGTGKIEGHPDQSIRRPIGGALHMAVRELARRHRAPQRIDNFDPGGPGGAPVEVPVFFAEGLPRAAPP